MYHPHPHQHPHEHRRERQRLCVCVVLRLERGHLWSRDTGTVAEVCAVVVMRWGHLSLCLDGCKDLAHLSSMCCHLKQHSKKFCGTFETKWNKFHWQYIQFPPWHKNSIAEEGSGYREVGKEGGRQRKKSDYVIDSARRRGNNGVGMIAVWLFRILHHPQPPNSSHALQRPPHHDLRSKTHKRNRWSLARIISQASLINACSCHGATFLLISKWIPFRPPSKLVRFLIIFMATVFHINELAMGNNITEAHKSLGISSCQNFSPFRQTLFYVRFLSPQLRPPRLQKLSFLTLHTSKSAAESCSYGHM